MLVVATTAGPSDSNAITLFLRRGWERPGSRSAGVTVETNNTTVAADGSPVTLLADSFNVQAGWRYLPLPEERFVLENPAADGSGSCGFLRRRFGATGGTSSVEASGSDR